MLPADILDNITGVPDGEMTYPTLTEIVVSVCCHAKVTNSSNNGDKNYAGALRDLGRRAADAPCSAGEKVHPRHGRGVKASCFVEVIIHVP